MNRERGIGLLAWALVLGVIAAFLGPALGAFGTRPVGDITAAPRLAQSWLALPFSFLWPENPVLIHNTTWVLSLLLAALGMAFLWRSGGGSLWASGTAALALVAAPYTATHLGWLPLLPPPFVLFAFGALVAALRRQRAGLATGIFWWLLALFLVLQAAWGTFGFLCAVLGVAVVKSAWFLHRISRREDGARMAREVARRSALPFLATCVGVGLLWRQPGMAFPETVPVPMGISLPGLAALGLFAVGWWRRGYLPFQRRRFGRSFLVLGALGMGLALVGDDRFSWLLTVAVCWWAAVGMEQLVSKYQKAPARWIAPLGPLFLVLVLALMRA